MTSGHRLRATRQARIICYFVVFSLYLQDMLGLLPYIQPSTHVPPQPGGILRSFIVSIGADHSRPRLGPLEWRCWRPPSTGVASAPLPGVQDGGLPFLSHGLRPDAAVEPDRLGLRCLVGRIFDCRGPRLASRRSCGLESTRRRGPGKPFP